jgi:hypothetical protein
MRETPIRIRRVRNTYAVELAHEAERERLSFEEAVLAMDDDVDPVAEFKRLVGMGTERDLNSPGKSRYRK